MLLNDLDGLFRLLATHLEELQECIKSTNLREVLHVVTEGAKDNLLLLVGALDDLLNDILLVSWVPPAYEIDLYVVAHDIAEGVRHDSFRALLDDSLNFCPGKLVLIFHDVVFESATLGSKDAHQGLR